MSNQLLSIWTSSQC